MRHSLEKDFRHARGSSPRAFLSGASACGSPFQHNFSGTREGHGAGDLGGEIFDELGFDDFKI